MRVNDPDGSGGFQSSRPGSTTRRPDSRTQPEFSFPATKRRQTTHVRFLSSSPMHRWPQIVHLRKSFSSSFSTSGYNQFSNSNRF
ncbi:hypothetical protein RchiOBHm_Chr5g0051781 [Rosa chinensis]|uniref:Uncharacterized protein n=1 Tax=Rosa chinensis TaxID=74649 RepID=A0A2P6QFG7_ROSCH|nr:hypothetical protein RchiOBHm_Chr5g0051781 [Rosa chinensis]